MAIQLPRSRIEVDQIYIFSIFVSLDSYPIRSVSRYIRNNLKFSR